MRISNLLDDKVMEGKELEVVGGGAGGTATDTNKDRNSQIMANGDK